MQVDLGQGVKIGYRIQGKGSPILLITGFGATMDLWSKPFLDALAEDYQVIIFDNRGTGSSLGPGGPVSINDFASDAIGLMDKLGLSKAHVFGISMGGMIAQQIAVSYPDRVHKLILGATTCASKFIKKNPALLGLFVFRIFPAFAMQTMLSKEFIAKHPEAIEPIKDYAKKNPTNLIVLRLQSAAVRGYDLSEKIQEVKLPTLVMTGTGDKIINPENSDLIAAKISNAKLVKFPGAGHLFSVERLQETLKAVRDFLG